MGLYGLKEDARYQFWRVEAEDLGTKGWSGSGVDYCTLD